MREVVIRALMNRTRFTDRIRIDPKQKEWVRLNKGRYKTLAGKLDEIINFYKHHGSNTMLHDR